MAELGQDASTQLDVLLRVRYPGALTEYADCAEDQIVDDYLDTAWEDDDVAEEISHGDLDQMEFCDSHCLRTLTGLTTAETESSTSTTTGVVVNGGDDVSSTNTTTKDLNQLSAKAETLMPKSVINNTGGVACPALLTGRRLRDYQLVGLGWLRRMYDERLPAILADDKGLGRRVTAAAFISYLVVEAAAPGPHLLLAPASSLGRWQRVLTAWAPGLRVLVLSGSMRDSVKLRQHLAGGAADNNQMLPQLVLSSYRAFYRDSDWLVRRRWGVVLMAEVQNVVAAGSPDQMLALCELRSDQRTLFMTGPHKENPIDLWNLVYLLFPATFQLHSEAVVKGKLGILDFDICKRSTEPLVFFNISNN